jgi:UDP-N-acetyl-D-glucosamine dehydrogenase
VGGDAATPSRVVVVGQGYVGLPIAMRAVQVGYNVVGLDLDVGRVKGLIEGTSHIEDVANTELTDALATGRYRVSSDYDDAADFDYAIIAVPTPLREGLPDLSYIEDAAAGLAPHLRPGATVILESTTYPGTTEELVIPILEEISKLSAGPDFYVGYSPERIDPGNATYNFVNTPKVVAGLDAQSLESVERLYRSLVDRIVPVSSCKVAELTKLLENTFRHVNIALVNELAMFAHDLGVDVWEAIEASSTKPFGYMRFTPGPGVGGQCLPIDPSYLSWRVKRTLGQSFRFVELANDVNDHMPDYVVRRLMFALNRKRLAMNGARVLVLGVAYKKNTSDARESPAVRVSELLAALGCEVRIADSHVATDKLSQYTRVEITEAELRAADATVLLVDHDDFDLPFIASNANYLLDTRNCIDDPQVEHL